MAKNAATVIRVGHTGAERDVDAPLRAYAAIGDGRTVALVADDGAVEWLPLPDLDSPSVFASVLDSQAGGRFTLAPCVPFRTTRRYLPATNVLETTFITDGGVVRVLDAMTMRGATLGPLRELQRRVDGVSGRVPIGWQLRPRFRYGERATVLSLRGDIPIAAAGSDALALLSFGAGTARIDGDAMCGRFEATAGSHALLAVCAAHHEPLVFPTRRELDERFNQTVAAWQTWAAAQTYDGAWHEAVTRSALVLKLLVAAPSGALAAAATTSLPEEIGGERNWDYRFCWVRDAAFTLNALLRLGSVAEARAYFWWLMQASQLTHPRLQPLYRLDGGAHAHERVLKLRGYAGSRPVRVGNAAAGQLQLDTYGELLQTAWLYAQAGQPLDRDIGRRLAEIADLVCRLWREPDSGIWEVRSVPKHFTHSKMMCWVALDRAVRLAERRIVPDRHAATWQAAACEIRDYVEQFCFDEQRGSYVRFVGGAELDASVLLGLLGGYGVPDGPRWVATVDAIRADLGHGPYLYRYTGEDGLAGTEGAFVSCSFWLAEALASTGRVKEATALMSELVALANDVGLYAEEIDPQGEAFLGNFPQALSHLSLISAAAAISQAGLR